MFKKILVATTPSEQSHSVIEEAIALAALANAQMMFLHVLAPTDEGYPTPVYPIPDGVYHRVYEEALKTYAEQWQVYEHHGMDFLHQLVHKAGNAGVLAEFTQIAGEPGRSICALAQTWNADLILIGRRGRNGLSELFLGSVSNYVLHHAPCSVLTVQGKPVSISMPIAETAGVAIAK